MEEMNIFTKESKKKQNNLIHYEGKLGVFDYNPEDYELLGYESITQILHYKGKTVALSLPKGIIDTSYMFNECEFPEGFHFVDFDTSNVISMEAMFEGCTLPHGFTLGDKFYTCAVTTMSSMFAFCNIPVGFSLGANFDTSNVTVMEDMFCKCRIAAGFSLGSKFDTSNVESMVTMFERSILPADFTLGDKFDTSNVTDMGGMFNGCHYDNENIFGYFSVNTYADVIEKLSTVPDKVQKYYDDQNRLGLLIADGYDCGWSTESYEEFSYDKRIIQFWLEKKPNQKQMLQFLRRLDISMYSTPRRADLDRLMLSYGGLKIVWIPKGTYYYIENYDGKETVITDIKVA